MDRFMKCALVFVMGTWVFISSDVYAVEAKIGLIKSNTFLSQLTENSVYHVFNKSVVAVSEENAGCQEAYEELRNDGVLAIIGPTTSDCVKSLQQLDGKILDVPTISPTATRSDLTVSPVNNAYFFRTALPDSERVKSLRQLDRGVPWIAIYDSDNEYSAGLKKDMASFPNGTFFALSQANDCGVGELEAFREALRRRPAIYVLLPSSKSSEFILDNSCIGGKNLAYYFLSIPDDLANGGNGNVEFTYLPKGSTLLGWNYLQSEDDLNPVTELSKLDRSSSLFLEAIHAAQVIKDALDKRDISEMELGKARLAIRDYISEEAVFSPIVKSEFSFTKNGNVTPLSKIPIFQMKSTITVVADGEEIPKYGWVASESISAPIHFKSFTYLTGDDAIDDIACEAIDKANGSVAYRITLSPGSDSSVKSAWDLPHWKEGDFTLKCGDSIQAFSYSVTNGWTAFTYAAISGLISSVLWYFFRLMSMQMFKQVVSVPRVLYRSVIGAVAGVGAVLLFENGLYDLSGDEFATALGVLNTRVIWVAAFGGIFFESLIRRLRKFLLGGSGATREDIAYAVSVARRDRAAFDQILGQQTVGT